MKKEFTAGTVEEAKALAAAEFGTQESKIAFEVLEEPKKGFLGKVKGTARISAEYEMSRLEAAMAYIRKILKCMDVEAELIITESENGATIDISGESTGFIIGRRGETLDALQYLASMAANKGNKDYYRITLDSCGYREKRKTILEELAQKISKTVMRTGRTSTLEPMNPYERRIIHSAVADIDGVSSKSIGDEPFRKIIITPANQRYNKPFNRDNQSSGGYKRDTAPSGGYNKTGSGGYSKPTGGTSSGGGYSKPASSGGSGTTTGGGYNKSGGGYNKPSGGYNRDNNSGGYRRDNRGRDELPTKAIEMGKSSFEKDYKRPKPEDDMPSSGLYGKIEI